MVVAGDAEGLEPGDFGFYVVGFQVQVHAFFVCFPVAGLLQQDPDVGVGKAQAAVDRTA
jgi:hypothetical protein